jgi:hypothetical protein
MYSSNFFGAEKAFGAIIDRKVGRGERVRG